MAELADALDSGSNGRKAVQVQVLLPAPRKHNPNQIFPVGERFGLCFSLSDMRALTSETARRYC